MEDNRVPSTYDRYLSPLDVWAIAFGCTVGWGAFIMPGTTFLPVAGPIGTLIAMLVSLAIVLVIGVNFSFLMRRKPGTGGVYAYTKEAFGREHAFLCAWFLCLSYLTIVFMNATSLFIIIRTVFGDRLRIGYNYYHIGGNVIFMGEVGASIIALAGVGLLFINAKPLLQRLHTVLSVALLAGVLIVAAVCLPHLRPESLQQGAFGIQGNSPAFAVFSLVMLAPWAFVGFEVISLETAHFDFKLHRSRWIIVASILLSGLVYILLTFVSVAAVPDGYASWQAYIADLGQLDGPTAVPAFYSARAIMGPVGLVIVALAAVAAILTGMIAAYRATTRVLSTMAEDNILSERLSSTNNSILLIMVVSIVISLLGRNLLECFMDLTAFGAIVGFGYTSASAWRLARRSGNRPIVVTGVIGTVLSLAFAVVELVPRLTALETLDAQAFMLLALWCLAGFMFYLRTVARSREPINGTSPAGVVLFAVLLYSALMWLAKRLMAAESLQAVHSTLQLEGTLMLVVIFIGLCVMMYIQQLLRRKQAALRRELKRATHDKGPSDGDNGRS